MTNRAYSILNIKATDEAERIIEGVASTPTVDRVGDVVVSEGARFKLPMPLLWQHQHDKPVGHVEFARAKKDGIPFRARILQTNEPGTLKDRLDEAWQSVRMGLVRAVSIGFMPITAEPMREGGWRFLEWAWHELSLVTIPANQEATISTVKFYDMQARNIARPSRVVRLCEAEPPRQDCVTASVVRALSRSRGQPFAATVAATVGALAKSTDAEISALQARLDAIEGSPTPKGLSAADRAEMAALAAMIKNIPHRQN